MNRFYVDWVNDLRTPPYIRTILGHFHVYWSNWVRLHRTVSRVIHAIHVPRNLRRYASDNFRTKYKSVFLGPVRWMVGWFVGSFQSDANRIGSHLTHNFIHDAGDDAIECTHTNVYRTTQSCVFGWFREHIKNNKENTKVSKNLLNLHGLFLNWK